MKDLKKLISSGFASDRSRLDFLAEELTKELEASSQRLKMLENAVSLMQEAMVRIEATIQSIRMENEK